MKYLTGKLKNIDIFNLLNSVVVYYLFVYLFPLLVAAGITGKLVNSYTAPFDLKVISIVALGILSLVAGYSLSKRIVFSRDNFFLKFLARPWNFKRGYVVFSLVLISDLIIKYLWVRGGAYFHLRPNPISISDSFYSLLGSLGQLTTVISLAIAFILYFSFLKYGDSRYKKWKIIAWIVFCFEFFYAFFASERFLAIIPIVVYLMIRQYVYERSFWRPILAAILVVFILMPVMNFYKVPENFFHSYMFGGKSNNSLEISKFVLDSSVGRVSQYPVLYRTFNSHLKFLYGEDLLNFFVSLGPPRFIWKNKPIINPDGNVLARDVGLLPENDKTTTIGFTVLGDWYINFGLLGIVLGMLFMGFIFGIFYSLLIKNSPHSFIGLTIYAMIWLQIVQGTENFIAPVYAGLVKYIVIMVIIFFFATSGHDKKTPAI